MASSRAEIIYSYLVEEIDEHILASRTQGDIYFVPTNVEGGIEFVDTALLEEQEKNHPALTRYMNVSKKPINRTLKIALIASMIREDDLKEDEYDLDHYSEIFSNFPMFPYLSLDLLKLFCEAGIFLQHPKLLNTLFIKTIENHSICSPLYNYAEYLLLVGANPNYNGVAESNNPNKLTALHHSLLTENDDLTMLTLKMTRISIDYTLQDNQGRTVLVLAAKMRKTHIFQSMLKDKRAQAALTICDKENRNALHYGYLFGDAVIVNESLLTRRINASIQDIFGNTPLKLLFAAASEIKRVLNSVLIDENRHPLAQKNFFYLTHSMPIGLPMSEQLKRGLLMGEFDTNGKLLPLASFALGGAQDTIMIPILTCSVNANYVKQFRRRIIELNTDRLPHDIKAMMDFQAPFLDSMISSPMSVLQACTSNAKAMVDALPKPKPSAFSIFSGSVAQLVIQSQLENKDVAAPAPKKGKGSVSLTGS
jgi:ankyrin repeat protein